MGLYIMTTEILASPNQFRLHNQENSDVLWQNEI